MSTQTLTMETEAVGSSPLNLLCKGRANGTGIQWSLTRPDGSGAGTVDIPQGNGPVNVSITIRPPENSNVTFRIGDPMWAGETGCPPPRGINSAQISNVSCPDGQVLTFTDANSGSACDVTYQLNFSDGTSFDPVLRNGGGK